MFNLANLFQKNQEKEEKKEEKLDYKELIKEIEKEDKGLAEELSLFLLEEPEIKESLKKSYNDLKSFSEEFAKLFGKGFFFHYKFQYSNKKMTIDQFILKLLDYIDSELETKSVKTLTQKLQFPLLHASAFQVANQRAAGVFFKEANEYITKIINGINYLSQVMKELAIWERINRLYEDLITASKTNDKILAETAMIEIKNFWLNNYDKNNSLFELQRYGFAGIVNDFLFFWEENLIDLLLSDNVEERRKAIKIIVTIVKANILKKDLVVGSIKEDIEKLKEKYKQINDIIKELENEELKKKSMEEIDKKIKELDNLLNKVERDIRKQIPSLKTMQRYNILSTKLRNFYDWLYTNKKVVRAAYLNYRALIRLLLFSLYENVKYTKWLLKMYELSRIHEGLNPINFEYWKNAYFEFTLLIDLPFKVDEKILEELGHKNKELDKDSLKLVIFVKIFVEGEPIFDQTLNFYNISNKYKMDFFYSLLTDEELEKLRLINLSKELEEIEFIGKEFIENFLREIREYLETDFFFSLSDFYKKKNYYSEDLIKILERKNPLIAAKVRKYLDSKKNKEEKKENEKNQDLLKEIVAIIVLILIDIGKLLGLVKEGKKEENKEMIKIEDIRKEIINKGVTKLTDFMKEKAILKLKEHFGVRKEFLSDKLFRF